MPSYIRYQQTNRLRDKSTLFFLCSFILVVVYTSVIGFVIVHVLKVTKSVEDDNEELLRTNQKLEENLEQLIFRIENLEEIISNNKSAINIISRPGTAETGTKENMQERRNEEKHNK